MNLNALILTNIQSSHYFKVNLYELKTYHEVIDEIYYKVNHLEPWEKGSRKTAGQTGMCGGVRGVGAGGIVSTAYCLLYKLFTLKLTRKQVNGLITHPDSPYIRALGFMYIRYTQPPADLWDWYDEYLEDPEELDVKAGGGQVMTIGNILKNFLCKLEWFSTLFPRIPVPIQQKLEKKMNERFPPYAATRKPTQSGSHTRHIPDSEAHFGEAEKASRIRSGLSERRYSKDRDSDRRGYTPEKRGYSDRDYSREREKDYSRDKEGTYSKDWKRDRDRSDVKYRSKDRDWDYNRDKERDKRSSRERRGRSRSRSRDKYSRQSRSRSRDRYNRHSSKDRERSGGSSKDRHSRHRY
ncbi:pre-mRNA-splicing factor 38B isoform X2 [Lycorma delicatula]